MTTPALDATNHLHTVGRWQHLVSQLGRISSVVARLTPDSPRSLCGHSLVVDEMSGNEHLDQSFTDPICPLCERLRTWQW